MTNTFQTGNPVPSTSPLDLSDNVSNMDEAMNSTSPSFLDRTGKRRQTWAGAEYEWQQFLINMGYEPLHLVYADGSPLVVARPTQLIDRGAVAYRVKTPATFPVTLSGTWATDQALVVEVGDSPLRQDLANSTDVAKGAGQIGYKRNGTGAVGRVLSAKLADDIDVTDFGAVGDGVTDNWAAFEAARLYAESRVDPAAEPHAFPRIWVPDGSYGLSKPVWFRKAHRIDGGGARIFALPGFTGQTVPKAGGGTEVLGAMFIFLDGSKGTVGVDPQWRAFVGAGITLDAQFRTDMNLYIERMAYATIECELQASSQDGLQVGPWCWGLDTRGITIENFGRFGMNFLESAAANGVSITGPRIWGRFTDPEAGIVFQPNAQCYGVSISGGFIEKLTYGVLISQGNGPMSIDGVDFEQCVNGCVRVSGPLIASQGIGTISIRNSLLHSTVGPKVYAAGGRIDVDGCRLGLPATGVTIDFETGADGVISAGHNEYQGNVPNIATAGANVFIRTVDSNQEIDDSYISHKISTPLTDYARRLHQYKDAPFLQSGGFGFQSSYAGGGSGQYVSQSDWFVTEYLHLTSPGAPSKVIGVRLSTFSGSSAFKPTTTGTVMCGEAASAWAGGATVVAFTVTSDRRTKQDETELSEAEHRVALALKGLIRKFKRKDDGPSGKWHVGVVAQDVCAAFTDQGLSWRDYEIVKHTEWSAQEEVTDDRGQVVVEAREAGDLFGVNYEELLAFVVSAM